MIKKVKKSMARKPIQDTQDVNFRERVRTHVLEVLWEDPATTFEHILKKSLNCDPNFLLDIIHELQEDDYIFSTEGQELPIRYWLKATDDYPRQKHPTFDQPAATLPSSISLDFSKVKYLRELLQEMFDSLPEPTPVYSQWWFSESIYENLIKLVLQLSKPCTSLAFIGSSTLGAILSHFSTNPVNILDIDEVLLEKVGHYCSASTKTIRYDMSKKQEISFEDTFQFVFVDPPWSRSALRTFLLRSATFASIGGTLAISFPPILTRPSAESERRELLNLAKSLGLSLKFTLQGFTEYSVPDFERNAYEHCGIHLQGSWRRGDLFIFTKIRQSPIDITPLIEEMSEWSQYSHGKFRLFLKRDGRSEYGQPSVQPIPGLKDLIYKSASTRMSSWKSASLVSTRNHIAHAYGRKELSTLLERTFGQCQSNPDKGTDFASMIPVEIRETLFAMLGIVNSQSAKVGE